MEESNCIVDPGTEFALWNLLDRSNHLNPVLHATKTDRIKQLPPWARQPAVSSLPVKLAHSVLNKSKRAVFCVAWTPDGRRLLAGTMSGEFNLFHGMDYSVEMVMQAHESAVRCMRYSPSGDWLISGDQEGGLKVWQPNFNNVKMVRAHPEVLRDVCWSPSGSKFATCSDDGSVKIWSFASMANEHTFAGRNAHGWDVKCVDWHPSLGLLASGSKDNTMRMWDPRERKLLTTVHAFKNTVTKTKFQPTGGQNLLAATCRDNTAHVFDLRMLGQENLPNASKSSGASGFANGVANGGVSGGVGGYASSSGVAEKGKSLVNGQQSGVNMSQDNISKNAVTDTMETSSTVAVLRGHPADVSCLEWHPYHSQLLATGTHQGSMHYFLLDNPSLRNDVGHLMPAWSVDYAHQWPVWDLAWHPVGHNLASGSNDKTVRVWKRADAGDQKEDLEILAPDEAIPTPPSKRAARKPPGLP